MKSRVSCALACKVAVFLLLISAAQAAESRSDVPRYTNDPSWPKTLPHDWVMGQVGGLAIDGRDRIWGASTSFALLP